MWVPRGYHVEPRGASVRLPDLRCHSADVAQLGTAADRRSQGWDAQRPARSKACHMAMGQNLQKTCGFSGMTINLEVHWGYRVLTHIHILLHILYLSDLSDLSCHVAEA